MPAPPGGPTTAWPTRCPEEANSARLVHGKLWKIISEYLILFKYANRTDCRTVRILLALVLQNFKKLWWLVESINCFAWRAAARSFRCWCAGRLWMRWVLFSHKSWIHEVGTKASDHWENDRKCTRSSPKNTEMHRTTGFSAVCWCVHSLVQVHAAQPFPGRSGFLISRGFHHPRPCSKSKVFRFGGSNRLWPLWEYLADQMCRAVLYQALVWYVFVVRHTTCNSERDFAATLLYLTISICCLQSSSKINMEF